MRGRRITFNCGHCGREVEDYASNRRRPTKTGERFCSTGCAGRGRRRVLSLALGGDGVLRTKKEKDAIHYRKTADRRRAAANAYYLENRISVIERLKAKDRAAKQAVVDAYGGECVCCGESQIEFLTIDHINGDGHLHRRKVGKGRRIYNDLIRLGFPKDNYRLLCFNCNIARGFYGYCPHNPADRQVFDKRPLVNAGRPRKVV